MMDEVTPAEISVDWSTGLPFLTDIVVARWRSTWSERRGRMPVIEVDGRTKSRTFVQQRRHVPIITTAELGTDASEGMFE